MGERSKDKNQLSEELTLDDVLSLGGDKKDFELIQGLDEEDEVLDSKEDLEAEPVKKDEIRDFIKGLEFWKVMQVVEEDTPTKKLLKAPKTEEEKLQGVKESETKTSKKKKKNKFKVQDDEISSTTDSPKPELEQTENMAAISGNTAFVAKYKPRKHALINISGKWYEQFDSDPIDFTPIKSEGLEKLRSYAQTIMQNELTIYKKQQDTKKSSDAKWIKTVLSSGTLGDKSAAYTLQIQESPLHNLSSLDSLVGMVKVKGRREALMVIDTLKELFMELLPDRKLVKFEHHPLADIEALSSGNNDTRDKRIMLWYFEERLKERYAAFVTAAQKLLQDQLPGPKVKVLDTVYELLASKPEEEKLLLSMLVNKLGDPHNKVSAKSTSLLRKLVGRHPNMKMVVVLEMERLLYRPNIAQRAQYYGICFLNQLILTRTDQKLASKLVAIYFSFFKAYTNTKKNESKMLGGLLTGVNRAFPFATVDNKVLEDELDTLYKTVHTVNFNTAVQALMLLYHTMDASSNISDRYYLALYRKLLDPNLGICSKQAMFLNLIYKSMKKDDSDSRIKGFIKRLLQICSSMSTNFICGSLMLLSEVLHEKPHLLDIPKIARDLDFESDDDDMEHFDDVKSGNDNEGTHIDSELEVDHETEVKKVLGDKGETTVKASWVHLSVKQGKDGNTYDMLSRNPMYCHAERESVWELKKLEEHYHPTVTMFANSLLKGKRIKYDGDPLQDFTLITFLDRFVYKNPKKVDKEKSGLARKAHHMKQIKQVAVNTEKYLKLAEKEIPVDEKFYYRYFNEEAKRKGATKLEDFDENGSDVSDEEFDEFLADYEKNLDGADANFDFDFASEFGKQKKLKKTQKGEDDDDESDFDLDEFENLSDEEFDFGDDENFMKAFESDEDAGEAGSNDDELLEGEDDDGWESGGGEADDMGDNIKSGKQMGADDSFDEEELAYSDDEMGKTSHSFTLGDLANPKTKQFDKTKKKRKAAEDTTISKKQKRRGGDDTQLFAAGEEFSSLMDDNTVDKFGVGTEARSNKDNAHAKQLRWEANQDQWMNSKDWKSRKQQKGKSFKGHGQAKSHGKGANKLKGKFKKRK